MKTAKEKVLELYPNAKCESLLSSRYANKPKHIQRRETFYAVNFGVDNPQYSGKRFVGHSAQKAWESAFKWFENPLYN